MDFFREIEDLEWNLSRICFSKLRQSMYCKYKENMYIFIPKDKVDIIIYTKK